VILIVDRRNDVLAAYTASFKREGMGAIGLEPDDFASWLRCTTPAEVLGVEIFLVGGRIRLGEDQGEVASTDYRPHGPTQLDEDPPIPGCGSG
jgi:hypothetical protein